MWELPVKHGKGSAEPGNGKAFRSISTSNWIPNTGLGSEEASKSTKRHIHLKIHVHDAIRRLTSASYHQVFIQGGHSFPTVGTSMPTDDDSRDEQGVELLQHISFHHACLDH